MRPKDIAGFLVFLVAVGVLFYVGRPKLASFFYNRGCSAYDAGRYDNAIQDFKQSLTIDASVSSVHYMLGLSYESKNMNTEAISAYEQAIQLDPKNTAAVSTLSEMYLNENKYKEALEIVQKAQQKNPTDERLEGLAQRISMETATYYLGRGNDAFLSADTVKAYEWLQQALTLKPDFAFAHYTLGFFSMMQHKRKEAEAHLKETIRIDPKFFLAYKLLADLYVQEGHYEEALQQYRKGIKVNDQDSSIYNDLGILLDRLERYDEAIGYLKKALELDPANLDIAYSLASTYRDNNDFEMALVEYQKILNARQDYPHVYNDLGDIYATQAKLPESQQAYRHEIYFANQRIKKDARDVASLNDLAYALNKSGQTAQAKQTIDKALSLSPRYAQAYLTLSKVQESMNDFKGAQESLKKARTFFGDASFIQKDMAKVAKEIQAYQKRGKPAGPRKETSFRKTTVPRAPSKFTKTKDTASPASQAFVSIELKNGRQISGRILKEDDERIVLEIVQGKTIGTTTINRDDINRIDK